MKKINRVAIKKFVVYAKNNLVLRRTMKNTMKSKIIVITPTNIEKLPIIFVI